jgi:serine/threonine-protein kinase HipA
MRKLKVRLHGGGEPLDVGTLALQDRRIYFEYAASFVGRGLQLSPIHLPLRAGIHQGPPEPFAGLPGVFADSLPDGWGLLLMDRAFRQRGISRESLTPLDRLAFLGSRAMGALAYHPPIEKDGAASVPIDLDDMAEQSQRVLEGRAGEVAQSLLRAGIVAAGERPKVVIGHRESDGAMVTGDDRLPTGYRPYVVKFDARGDAADGGVVELAYARMAAAAGIRVPSSRVFATKGGGRYFAAERFDRPGGERRHAHSLAGLLGADFRIPSLDYEAFLRATLHLTRDHQEVVEAFRRMVFNLLACNRDDHARNFAYLMEPDGTWRLTPAYDLTYSTGPGGEHTMAIAGEGRAPARAHLAELAKKMSIAPAAMDAVVEQVDAVVREWPSFAAETGVAELLMIEISERMAKIRPTVIARRATAG